MKIHGINSEIVSKQIHALVARLGPSSITARTAVIAAGVFTFALAMLFLQVVPSLKTKVSKDNPPATPSEPHLDKNIEGEKARIKRLYEQALEKNGEIHKDHPLIHEIAAFMSNFGNQAGNPYYKAVEQIQANITFVTEESIPVPVAIKGARQAIEDAYEKILKNLSSFQTDPLPGIWKQISTFKETYHNWPTHREYRTVVQMEDDLRYVRQIDLRPIPFSPINRQDERGVVLQPDDGNCVFHACRTGLLFLDRRDVPFHEGLRKQVVEWMRQNYDKDDRLPKAIERATKDIIVEKERDLEAQRNNLNFIQNEFPDQLLKAREQMEELERTISHLKQKSYEEYFRLMSQSNTMANEPEMLAISELYQVGVRVAIFMDNQIKEEGTFSVTGTDRYEANGWVTLIYEDEKRHYNAWALQELQYRSSNRKEEK